MIIPWRRGTSATHLRDDALSALTAADWTAAARPVAWLHWPIDQANPYQVLIYSRFAAHNLIPIRLARLADVEAVTTALPDGVPAVLHVHWLYDVTKGARTEAAAAGAAQAFQRRIERLREAGVRLVWTVHNLLPHETAYAEIETAVRRFMLSTAEVVHVMHDSHPGLLREAFGLEPARVVVASHPSLVGAVPDWTDRPGARAWLGIPAGARVLVTLGQIRPYKGHGAFLDVLDLATKLDPRLRWLVAGKIRDEPGTEEFLRHAARHPAVLLHPGFVPDAELQFYLRAGDAAAFPYLRSLNSGAVALAATFGLAAYASAQTQLADLLPDGAAVRFDLADVAGSAQVVAAGGHLETETTRTAVADHARTLRAEVVSDRLASALRAWVDGG